MATSFPTSIDSPTDPIASNPMNSPSHAGEHTNANDAIVAIETAIGITGAFNFTPAGPVPTGTAATDTAAVQAVLTAAGTTGTAYLTQPGTFAINATLHSSSNLVMGPSTILQASTGLSGPVLDSPVGTFLQNVNWTGGTIDANGKAGTQCLYARMFGPMFIDINCINAIVDFVILGDPGAAYGSYAATLGPNMSIIAPAGHYAAGYSCLWINNATDCVVYLANVQGAETGVRSTTGDNRFITTHPNGNAGTQPMVQCFFDSSDSNSYIGCEADSVSALSHSGATGSASNNTITDAAVKAQHQGLPVTGANIPAGSYVGAVTSGTSFLLVTATGTTSTPTGAVSGITLVGVGWNFLPTTGYPSSVVSSCTAFQNSLTTDNTCYALTVGPGATTLPISNFNVVGNDITHRWIAAFAGNTGVISYSGLQQTFVVTTVQANSNALAAPVVFTSSGTWTPSATGAGIFRALVVAGGAGGVAGATTYGGGGGGGGEVLDDFYLGHVTAAQTVTIGAGGVAGANGNATTIGALVSARAGWTGAYQQYGGSAGTSPAGPAVAASSGLLGSGNTGGTSGSATGSGGQSQLLRLGNGGGGGGYLNGVGGYGGGGGGFAGGAAVAGAGGGGGSGSAAGSAGVSTTGGAGAAGGANTGNGGGGGGAGTTGGAGGAGGSGYIIIYQVA